MLHVFETVEKIRDTTVNVLITGENGTGKDLVARLIHERSPRNGKIFVSVDLGAIPETLFESELFGYEKGAFTDARRNKLGRMEAARGGTLFLDEVGNVGMPMQSKLLSAIEKQQITKLGSTRPVSIDVRLISATNAHLHEMVERGLFRQDLLYRLNTIEIVIPPLRDRGDDLLLLANHFLRRFTHKYGKEFSGRLPREVALKLKNYQWPGNVRELEHAVERAVLLSQGRELKPEHFMLYPVQRSKSSAEEELNLEKIEKSAIIQAVRRADGNINRAADLLGITRYALYRKLIKYAI
jgi:transcriptional regulator with PAS, ATPase and Fis domain